MRRLKPTRRDSAPSLLAAVGLTTSPRAHLDANGDTPHVFTSAHVTVTRRTARGWGKPVDHECDSPARVWDVLDALGAGGRRPYVVAGRASDALTVLGWWQRVEAGEVSIWDRTARHGRAPVGKGDGGNRVRHPLVTNGRPDVIGYSLHNCSFRWVSVTNWADISIADCARQVGYPIPAAATEGDKWESSQWPAADQSATISRYMMRLIDWWLTAGCGVWADTPGAAAWKSYLRRLGANPILSHDDERALRLEAGACHGGRASAFYFGPVGRPERWAELADAPDPGKRGFGVPGPVHRFDVRAMYPTLLRDERFPVRLLCVAESMPPRTLLRGLGSLLAVSRVLLDTPDALYPVRTRRGVVYPTGVFPTTLSTAELLVAGERGHLRKVGLTAWYTPGGPFREWATWGLGKRTEMSDLKDKAGEAFVKLLLNSLGGRLARRRAGWVARPNVYHADLWNDWWEVDADTGEVVQRRSLAGHIQEMVKDEFRPGTLGACYAHLTGYGREYMNKVRAVAGRREVLWQDTDGLTVTDTGRARIEASAFYHPTEYGKLRYDKPFSDALYLTAKHYWADGSWVLAGIHDGFSVPDGRHAIDIVTDNPARTARRPDESAVYRIARCIDLQRIEPGVTVDVYGWAVPPAFSLGESWRSAMPSPQLFPEVK